MSSLILDGSTTTEWMQWNGGPLVFSVVGTWNGATAKLQWSPDDGVTAFDVDGAAFTSDDFIDALALGEGDIRVNIAGAGGSTDLQGRIGKSAAGGGSGGGTGTFDGEITDPLGSQADATSISVASSTEDKAARTTTNDSLSTISGRVGALDTDISASVAAALADPDDVLTDELASNEALKAIYHLLAKIFNQDEAAYADTTPFPTQDAGPSWTSVWGVSGSPVASADATGIVSVTDAPTSGQKLCIDDVIVTNRHTATMEFTFLEETSGTVIFGPWSVPSGFTMQITLRGKRKLPVANKKLQVDTSVAGNVVVSVGYHSEA